MSTRRSRPAVVAAAVLLTAVLSLAAVVALGIASWYASRPSGSPSVPASPAPSASHAVPSASHAVPSARPSSMVPTPGRPGPGASPAPTGPAAPPRVPADLLGRDIEAIPTSRRVVALTFDAGANADGLPAILATLHAGSVPATFFVTGDFAARDPAAVRRIVAGGHRLGNHSATHPHFTRLSDAAVRSQLREAEAAIRAAGDADPRPLFRFPYGDRDPHRIGVVNAAGYVCVRWTVDTLGWKGTGAGVTRDEVVSRVVTTARPGQIVLMHVGSNPDDGSTLDADALPAVIAGLRARGYGFVTLDASLS